MPDRNRKCDSCGTRMPAFTPRRKNKQTGQYECEGCRSGRPGMPLTEGAKHADVEDQISHGVMVAIVPPEGLAESLDIDPDIDDAHVTLVYLGKDHEIDQGLLYATTKAWAASHGPLTASVSGYGVFPVTDDGACLYATVDSPGLNEHRADLLHALGEVGIVGPSNHGFTPHMTLRYGATEVPLELPDGASDSWPIESVYVVHGPNWFEVPLAGAVKEASVPKTAQQPDVCRNCGDAIKWDSASMTWRSENPEPCTSPEGHWPFRPATGRRVVAHDSGDTEKVFHCFTGDTRYWTWDGIKTLGDTVGTIQRLLTAEGRWVDAIIHGFGEQPVWEVTVKRNQQRKVLRTTAEHRWIVRGRGGSWRPGDQDQIIDTIDLRPGDRLAWQLPESRLVVIDQPDQFGIAAGIVFGDGTRCSPGSSAVNLWGKKDAQLLKYFSESARSAIKTPNGVEGVRVGRLPGFFKDLPALDQEDAYLYGWLAGYFAADGHVTKQGQVVLDCADRSTLEFVQVVAARLGVATYGIRSRERLGFGKMRSIHRMQFVSSTLREDFFLIAEHRRRYSDAMERGNPERLGWTVEKIEEAGYVEEVFCPRVAGTESFVLEDWLHTKQCPFCGGGQVIGRSDGTIECGYCKAAFTVQVQPMHSGMPQTDPATGQPIDMPGMPGERGEAGVAPDPATTGEVPEMPDPAQPASQVPDGPPQGADAPADPAAVQPDKPTGEVPPQFRKGSAREVRGASRATIRRVLAGAGIPMVRPNDAMGASLVEFVDFTGIMSSVHEPRASHAAIIAALDAAGIAWEQGNYIMVPKPTVVEAASYYPGDPYWTTARRDGPCAAQGCARGIKVGDDIFYYPKGRSAYCPIHAQGAEADFLSARGDEDFYNGVGNPYAASRSEPMYVVDGMALDRTAFLKRMALAHADDRQAVLSQIKAERISG